MIYKSLFVCLFLKFAFLNIPATPIPLCHIKTLPCNGRSSWMRVIFLSTPSGSRSVFHQSRVLGVSELSSFSSNRGVSLISVLPVRTSRAAANLCFEVGECFPLVLGWPPVRTQGMDELPQVVLLCLQTLTEGTHPHCGRRSYSQIFFPVPELSH